VGDFSFFKRRGLEPPRRLIHNVNLKNQYLLALIP